MSNLTILCVTRGEKYALPFLDEMADLAWELDCRLVIAADGDQAKRRLDVLDLATLVTVRSHGYIESVLDDALTYCPDGYILRLDDDERPSSGMWLWLQHGEYEKADHWAFPRANLWPDENHRLDGGSLWPDLQTRLSVKEKSGGRRVIHCGSPFGTGQVAPVTLEHHKLLARSFDDRTRQAMHYERIRTGAGSGHYLAYQTPELADVRTVDYVERVPA